MSTNDGIPEEGTEPLEEVGPEGCEAMPTACDTEPEEHDAPPEECDFSPKEELVDEMPIEPIPVIRDPKDGLPRPVDSPLAFAPPFTHERVVCIEDAREYVEMFEDELASSGPWYRVANADGSNRCDDELGFVFRFSTVVGPTPADDVPAVYTQNRFDAYGQPVEREHFDPGMVVTLWGQACVKIAQDAFRPVRPTRPVCKHYRRQCFNNDDVPDPTEPGGRIYFTHCMRRRSIGGAFMSLKDQNVFACDHRDPPDEHSRKIHLDGFDDKRLLERAHETLIPLFGLGGDDVPADTGGQ